MVGPLVDSGQDAGAVVVSGDEGEFVAAGAVHPGEVAAVGLGEDTHESAEDPVAGGVAVGVVAGFEAVEVEQDHVLAGLEGVFGEGELGCRSRLGGRCRRVGGGAGFLG